jgi:hypothetical protein
MAKWTKGQSGNPGGRPSGLGEIREIARQHTDGAIETLVRVMGDKEASPSAQVAAASALLDRGWGRPAQTIDANINNQESFSDVLRRISESKQAEKESASVPLSS